MENSPSSAPDPESLAALHAQDAVALRALFWELTQLGAGIVRVIAQAVDDAAPAQLPALSAAHDKTMGSLRRTALLIQKLTAPEPAPRSRSGGCDEDSMDGGMSDAEILELLDGPERQDRGDRLDRVEGLDSGDALGQRPLPEIIATILRDFGVTGLEGGDGAPPLTPADIAALYACATGLVAARQAGIQGGSPAEGGGAEGARLSGAVGCRDP